MKRDRSVFLIEWLHSNARKPLVIRGARQVGKTWIIRELAQSQQRQLIELNFEKRPDLQTLFNSNNPIEIITNINAFTGKTIKPSESILFLDEIQVVPQLLAKLRWFAEDMPDLPVIAAGSLLDFALAEHKFSMPVGRISYLYLEPLSFEEFLDATENYKLRDYIQNYKWNIDVPDAIHTQFIRLIKEYLIVGGMPASVLSWREKKDPNALNQIQHDLLATYREDFSKYKGRLSIDRLEDIMNSIPRQLGKKFVYSHANAEASSAPLKQALELLSKARVCHSIVSTSANGLPLGAEANHKFLKMILLDCGLCCVSLGLSLHQLSSIAEISLINNGAMAKQLTGQMLRTLNAAYVDPLLYYWHREKLNSSAEVDYIIQHENQVIPIEVKAGTTGSLKSLREFVKEKKISLAVRVNSSKPSIVTSQIADQTISPLEYKLISLPFYLLGQVHRLIKEAHLVNAILPN
jgi:predicted AAA+ superfamily ATPase